MTAGHPDWVGLLDGRSGQDPRRGHAVRIRLPGTGGEELRMWRRIEVNARVDHPVEQVFAYLANPLLWHEFAPACVFRRQIGDLPPDVGTRWMATDQIGPFRFHFVDELAELEPNRRVVWLSSAPWNARVEYLCTADGDRTLIRATYQGDVVGFLQVLVGWLPDASVRVVPRAGLPPAGPCPVAGSERRTALAQRLSQRHT